VWAVPAIALGVAGLLVLVAWWLWPEAKSPSLLRPGDDQPLGGKLLVRVWTRDGSKRGRQIGVDPRAVPVQEDEQLRLEAQLDRPAHAYLLWVDGKGKVTPLYPWNLDEIKHGALAVAGPPPEMRPQAVVRSPVQESKGWDVDDTVGMDTMLLLARRTPLPASVNLDRLIGKLPAVPLGPPDEVVERGFDRGLLVAELSLDLNRGPKKEAKRIDDQLQRLAERLRDHFELIRAVQFAHVKR
jgi:hypothetical protein